MPRPAARRFARQKFEDVQVHPQRLAAAARFTPLVKDGRRVPRMVLVNSMSDLHHEDIPDAFRHQVYDVMEANEFAVFQILTKRPGRMQRFLRARYGSRPTHIGANINFLRWSRESDSTES